MVGYILRSKTKNITLIHVSIDKKD